MGEIDANSRKINAIVICIAAFLTGAIVMSFEMLGSRYLNPYFGSGIYTWASLISTVLLALTAGYFAGGALADRTVSPRVLAFTVMIGSAYLLVLPNFSQPVLEFVLGRIEDVRTASLLAAIALMFLPVTLLGMYSPFAIRLLLCSPQSSGRVSGAVYGISTAGSIVGTLGTTFYLIPALGARAITLALGILGLLAGSLLLAVKQPKRSTSAIALILLLTITVRIPRGETAENLIDADIRSAMLKCPDGRIAHLETEHNDIFVTKRQTNLVMSFQIKGWDYTESVVNLADPDDLPLRYTQTMTVAVSYPHSPGKMLMLGLGGGSISAYLGRFIPAAFVTTVEVDPGVISAAKTYFGLRETERVRFRPGDGRVLLNRNNERYDLILLDAYRGGYVPFHLLTREFYALVKERLAPGGAAAFNVHDGTKLYASTLRTLAQVFPQLDLYPTGAGETIVIGAPAAIPRETVDRNAAALQEGYGFRFPLPQLVQGRTDYRQSQSAGDVITDDFAPADIYDVMGRDLRWRQ